MTVLHRAPGNVKINLENLFTRILTQTFKKEMEEGSKVYIVNVFENSKYNKKTRKIVKKIQLFSKLHLTKKSSEKKII